MCQQHISNTLATQLLNTMPKQCRCIAQAMSPRKPRRLLHHRLSRARRRGGDGESGREGERERGRERHLMDTREGVHAFEDCRVKTGNAVSTCMEWSEHMQSQAFSV